MNRCARGDVLHVNDGILYGNGPTHCLRFESKIQFECVLAILENRSVINIMCMFMPTQPDNDTLVYVHVGMFKSLSGLGMVELGQRYPIRRCGEGNANGEAG